MPPYGAVWLGSSPSRPSASATSRRRARTKSSPSSSSPSGSPPSRPRSPPSRCHTVSYGVIRCHMVSPPSGLAAVSAALAAIQVSYGVIRCHTVSYGLTTVGARRRLGRARRHPGWCRDDATGQSVSDDNSVAHTEDRGSCPRASHCRFLLVVVWSRRRHWASRSVAAMTTTTAAVVVWRLRRIGALKPYG